MRTKTTTLLCAAMVAAVLAGPAGALAANSTWQNVGTDFNTTSNWNAGVPGGGNIATFDVAAVTNPNLSTSLSIGQLNFSTAAAGGYTVSASAGQALTLTTTTAITSSNTSGTNTISTPLTLTSGTRNFLQAPGGTLNVTGDITESGGAVTLTLNRTASGGHTITLSGNNNYTGGTNLSGAGGKLNIGSATAIGTGTLAMGTSSHTVDNTSGGDMTLNNALALNNSSFTFSGSSSMTMNGALTFGGTPASYSVTVSSNTLTLNGAMSGGSGRTITKLGAGTLALGGGNTTTGPMVVTAGTLLVNGDHSAATGNVTVNSNATLGGTGIVGGATTINGKLSAGNSPGTLTFNASLTLANGSTAIFEAGDLVNVGGALTLTDNWTLALGVGFVDGGSVTLFNYGSLTASPDLVPTFNITNLGFTPSGTLSLTDTGSSIVLNGVHVIPEPASMALLAMGGLMMVKRRR